MKNLNLLVIFLLELAVLAAVCRWGFTVATAWPLKLLLGIGGPLVMIALWWLFGAPTATFKTEGLVRVLFELAWFGTGAAALATTGAGVLALVLGGAFVISKVLALLWNTT